MKHDLIKTGDADASHAILDRNHEVVLEFCRRCRRGEGELNRDDDCAAIVGEQAAYEVLSKYDNESIVEADWAELRREIGRAVAERFNRSAHVELTGKTITDDQIRALRTEGPRNRLLSAPSFIDTWRAEWLRIFRIALGEFRTVNDPDGDRVVARQKIADLWNHRRADERGCGY